MIERGRRRAPQRPIACADQTVGKLRAGVLPYKQGLLDLGLVFEDQICGTQEIRERAQNVRFTQLIATTQHPLGLEQHEVDAILGNTLAGILGLER